jgi:hypothetical protein
MNNSRDDYESVRRDYERVKRKPSWMWTDYDRDDIASWYQIQGLRAANEKLRLAGRLPMPPPPAPARSLVEELIAIGCIDCRSGARD